MSEPKSDLRFHTKNEAAQILQMNPRTVERFLRSGKLQGAQFGKAWRISDEDIQAFYEAVKEETVKALKERKQK